MLFRLLTLIIVGTAGAQAAPIRFIGGVYDSSGGTEWGLFSNINIEYSAPADLMYTFREMRGEGYVYRAVPFRIVSEGDEVLFQGTFGTGGLTLWIPNDAVTPYLYGAIRGTLSPNFSQALGFGDTAYNVTGMFSSTDMRYYSSEEGMNTGEWGLYIGTANDHVPAPEPAILIPTAGALLMFGVRRARKEKPRLTR
jgi:hypothetical protein